MRLFKPLFSTIVLALGSAVAAASAAPTALRVDPSSSFPTELRLTPGKDGAYVFEVKGKLPGLEVVFRSLPGGVRVDVCGKQVQASKPYAVHDGCRIAIAAESYPSSIGATFQWSDEGQSGEMPNQGDLRLRLDGGVMAAFQEFVGEFGVIGYVIAIITVLAAGGLILLLVVPLFHRRYAGRKQRPAVRWVERSSAVPQIPPVSSRPGPRPSSASPPTVGPSAAPAPARVAVSEVRVLGLERLVQELQQENRRLRADVERMVPEFVERCRIGAEEAAGRSAAAAMTAAQAATEENLRLVQRLGIIESRLAVMQNDARQGLTRLLESLPRDIVDNPAQDDADGSIARRLDEAVGRYLREEQRPVESLHRHEERTRAIHDSLREFQSAVDAAFAEQVEERLAPSLRDLRQIGDELAGFRQSGAEQRIRLLFAVDFSTHQATRQTLSEAIAAGLQREIVKLDSFDEFYAKRLGMTGAQAAAECADLADSAIDPQRADRALQSALASVFQAAEVQEIAPARNDAFLGRDHTMLQMVRRHSVQDRSGAVARLLQRGLRQQDRLIRKATVILFE